MTENGTAPTKEQVDKFSFLSPMLDSALSEMREFSKKKQDGIVSETKLKILNRLLADLKGVLAQEPSTIYLDLLSEGQLIQNSDAVLVLGQYRSALDSFKKSHRKFIHGEATWKTKEWIEAHEQDDEDDEDDDYDDENYE